MKFDLQSNELIVDNFAGGGGASLGIEKALGRSPDIAINHDPEAIAMHKANHPKTKHYCEDVWHVDPIEACGGRPVGLAWFSPDCKHFSKAKGGKPVNKKIRGLAWVVTRWAKAVKPRVIILENVEEFKDWGPLGKDNMPCKVRKGATFDRWKRRLENLGYAVEDDTLRACDVGTPTSRRRLFIVARCDGKAIVWPKRTHASPKEIAKAQTLGLKPWRTAAECIDWTIPCPSIFGRERPLADNTLRRVAAGLQRFVIQAEDPFIVNDIGATLVTVGYGERKGQKPRAPGLHQPVNTITAGGGKAALVTAFLAKHYKGVVGTKLKNTIGTITAVDHHSLVAVNLMHNTTGNAPTSPRRPLKTIATGGHHTVVATSLVKLRGTCRHGQPVTDPMATVSAQGTHFAEVRAFLVAYYGNEKDCGAMKDPMRTVTANDRFALVTIHGEQYTIADIGLRMLTPRELYRAQGFPDTYEIAPQYSGKPLTKRAQVRMCGNSVCPPAAAAMVRAQFSIAR